MSSGRAETENPALSPSLTLLKPLQLLLEDGLIGLLLNSLPFQLNRLLSLATLEIDFGQRIDISRLVRCQPRGFLGVLKCVVKALATTRFHPGKIIVILGTPRKIVKHAFESFTATRKQFFR